MKYGEFREQVANYPFFRSNIFNHLTSKPNVLRRQVVDWVERGLVMVLKRGVYTLSTADRSVGLSAYFLANNLYAPSYISLESAMTYYGFIPEKVHLITSVTTKKTQEFHNKIGDFKYHHIKTSAFNYFVTVADEFGNNFYLATPEKALIDFMYIRMLKLPKIDDDIFAVSYRLQNLEKLETKKLKMLAGLYNSEKMDYLIGLLIKEKEANA